MLSYGISNPFQPDFGLPLIFQHNLRFNGYNWSSSVHWRNIPGWNPNIPLLLIFDVKRIPLIVLFGWYDLVQMMRTPGDGFVGLAFHSASGFLIWKDGVQRWGLLMLLTVCLSCWCNNTSPVFSCMCLIHHQAWGWLGGERREGCSNRALIRTQF